MCLRKRRHVTHFETRDNQVLCSCWSPFTEFNRLISLSESCSFDGALTESKRAGSHPSSMPRALRSRGSVGAHCRRPDALGYRTLDPALSTTVPASVLGARCGSVQEVTVQRSLDTETH